MRRFERISTAPSAARRLSASRTGIWLTPSSSARPRVDRPAAGHDLAGDEAVPQLVVHAGAQQQPVGRRRRRRHRVPSGRGRQRAQRGLGLVERRAR